MLVEELPGLGEGICVYNMASKQGTKGIQRAISYSFESIKGGEMRGSLWSDKAEK